MKIEVILGDQRRSKALALHLNSKLKSAIVIRMPQLSIKTFKLDHFNRFWHLHDRINLQKYIFLDGYSEICLFIIDFLDKYLCNLGHFSCL